VPWIECATLFAPSTPVAAEAARLRGMHPSDVAAVIVALPIEQRRTIAAAMEDERLADVLEELPEEEQLRLIEGLDLERLNNVFDEMEYDDLADLLAKMGN
ncbi:MAG: magnesium transporter MgtE N-terminal domain-containing protein, partial [Ilumatobacteraceae bacterium]